MRPHLVASSPTPYRPPGWAYSNNLGERCTDTRRHRSAPPHKNDGRGVESFIASPAYASWMGQWTSTSTFSSPEVGYFSYSVLCICSPFVSTRNPVPICLLDLQGQAPFLLLRPRISGNTSSVDPRRIGFPAQNPKCRQTHTTTSRNPHYCSQYNNNTTDFYTKNPQSQAVFAITTAANISKPILSPANPTAKLSKIR